MNKKTFALASIVSLIPFLSLSAQLNLPMAPAAVEVAAANPAADDTEALKAEYGEFYSALKVFSNVAYVSPVGSPEYVEAAASGQYLRARIEGMASRILRATGAEYRLPAGSERDRGTVSYKVVSELNDVFGFYSVLPGAREGDTRGVPIKAGYCQINFVKNNVPFLVQYDGFLNKGEVILTFDDGPGALTEEVSAAMKEGKAPSIFFVLGRSLGDAGKARIKAEAADGHSVAVHGYGHATESDKPFTNYSTEKTVSQLSGVAKTITEATGAKPGFFRPPYGIISVDALNAIYSELNLVPVGWTIDTLDWSTKDPDTLFANTVSMIQKRGKGIVLMHDIHPQSRTAAKRLVGWLAANGYKVVSPERLTKAYKGE
ncbi:MAG: polysaccharide deacetylase family protein [Elusimicrobia bacterium]|nr:polysaccharide deacetylase family protein [Elusimicrobiota bacterium]